MAETAADKGTADKPVRVMEGEVVIGRCPLCTKPLVAQVEVEVRLGPLTIGKEVDAETGGIPVDVSAEPRLRRLQIEHECRAPAVKPRTRRPRTPRPPGSAPPAAPPKDETPPMPIELPPAEEEGALEGAPVYLECTSCGHPIDKYSSGPWFHVDSGEHDHEAVPAAAGAVGS